MKKALGQTVRDLKRGVNKKVLKVSGTEQKILDATSNEPWGPHGSHLADLAHASRNYNEYQLIMAVIWKRINDTGKNWRHVFKALTVLEYLVSHGSERVIDEIREHAYQISTLADFQYVDSGGRDQGSNVRRKSQSLVALVNDRERVHEIRKKALVNKDKYHGTSSMDGTSRASSYSGDDERRGYGRERDLGYRDDDRHARGRDSYSQDGDHHSIDSYRDDDFKRRGNDNYQLRSRSRSVDRYTDHSFDDDDRYSSRSGGGITEDRAQDERRLERTLSDQNAGGPPSYEEATNDPQSTIQDERDGTTQNESSSSVPKQDSPSRDTHVPDHAVAGESVNAPNKGNAFDGFDPRGSVSAAQPAPPAASSLELDIFGLSAPDSSEPLALVPATAATTNSEMQVPASSDFGMDFGLPSTSTALNEPSENPFGDSPFKATTQDNFPAQAQSFPPASSFHQPSGSYDSSETHPSVAPKVEAFTGFDFGDAFGGFSYAPADVNSQHSSASLPFSTPETQTNNDILDSIFPRTGTTPIFSPQEAQPAAPTNVQTSQMNALPPSGLSAPVASQGSPTNMHTTQMNSFPFSALPAASQGSPDTHTAQMNFFQPSGQSAPVASQGMPTSTQTDQMNPLPPSGLSDALQGSPNTHMAQMNYFQSGQSAPVASQAMPTNTQTVQTNLLPQSEVSAAAQRQPDTHTAQMNLLPQSGLPGASQGSPDTHTSQMNFFQPSGQSAPVASQGMPTNTQTTQMNLLPHSGLSAASQGQPETNTAQMNFFQPSGPSIPAASHGIATNTETSQMNPLPQAGLSGSTASQGLPTNTQTAQMNFQPSGMSVPTVSQGMPTNAEKAEMDHLPPPGLPSASQSSTTNTQTGQMNLFQPSGPSPPAASQGLPPNMQTSQMNFLQPSGLSALAAPQIAATATTNMQAVQSGVPANMQTNHFNLGPQSMSSDPFASAPAAFGQSAKVQPSKEKFQTKSSVWTDTLSRGLVDLNISGPKTNPNADIGVDFDAINRKEKRLEVRSSAAPPVTSTITMGRAMGSGSGIGRSAASGLAAPPNPVMGSGMGVGGMGPGMNMGGGAGMAMGPGMGMGMGGYGGNMNQPRMGMGGYGGNMNQPPMGMGGYGGNMNQPAMGMGGYGGNMNQPAMGMGGYGGNMNQPPMGMGGYGGNMNQQPMGMGMNMGMGQAAQMRPPAGMPPSGPGMPGSGYNPMTGMGGYGSQQPYGGGYR